MMIMMVVMMMKEGKIGNESKQEKSGGAVSSQKNVSEKSPSVTSGAQANQFWIELNDPTVTSG